MIFLIEHAVGIDQEGAGLAGDAGGDMVGDQVGHAVERHQAVAGGEIDAGLPFGWADRVAQAFDPQHRFRVFKHSNSPLDGRIDGV